MDKKYTITLYEGNRPTKTAQVSHGVRTYDSKIFPLYKSYAGGKGKETLIDKRMNVFNSKSMKIILLFALLLPVLGGSYLYNWYQSKQTASKAAHQKQDSKPQAVGTSASSGTGSPSGTTQTVQNTLVITGLALSQERFIVIVKNTADNSVKVYNNPRCVGSGQFLSCEIDNQRISYYR